MKTTRKLTTLLLALVMLFTLALGASAATVTNNTSHPYKAYQIFKGTQADNSPALGDVEWGADIDGTKFLAALQADDRFKKDETNIFVSCTTAMDVASALAANQDCANAFANVAAANLKTDTTPTEIQANATSVDLAAGYYLLVDSSTGVSSDAKNSALLQVTNQGDIKIDKKYSVPTPDKDITGVTHLGVDTDFTGAEAVDVEYGDTVEFTLTGTLPTNYDDYETYVYKFHDTLSTGLQYVANSAKVYVVNGETTTELTTGFTVSTTSYDDDDCNCNLLISCTDLKKVASVTSTSTIKVVYSAKLLGTATIGEPGNPNAMYIEYSNNPNQTGDGDSETGHTPEDKVLVFTYELDVTKIDGKTLAEGETATKLSGAEFVLLSSDKIKVAKVENNKLTEWVDVPTGEATWDAASKLTSGADGLFKIEGLDAGTYYLKEIKAPAGYNLLTEDVTIVISATITPADGTEGTGDPTISSLKIKVDNGQETDGAKQDGKYTGVLAATVENNQGGTLPETGGVGTTMFYVIGGALVLAAVVLLVTKKRMTGVE